MTETHYAIYLEVDRLYHLCATSEGRCAIISDYIVRLLNDRLNQPDAAITPADGTNRRAGGGV